MDKRSRVLWLIKGLGPGGAERLLVSAARAHDHQAFAYEVAYLLPHKRHLVDQLARAGVVAHCLDAPQTVDLRWALRLRRLLVDRQYDIVHVHSPMVAAVTRPLVRSLPASARPRIVYTEHNGWRTYGPLTRRLNAATFHLNDAAFAVSGEVHDSVARRFSAQVETVVHGVLIDEVRAQLAHRERTRAELGVSEGHVLVGTVANFRSQKAYPDLLAAARTVLDTGLPVSFVAVGQGPLEQELRARHAELNLGSEFRFLGYREDAVRVLAACDIFALASHYEGFPVALMEALVLGIPVVATAVGGVPDAVRSGTEGVLVPPGRPDRLANAVLELVEDAKRRASMAEAAAERGRQFDIRAAVARVEATYQRLLRLPSAGEEQFSDGVHLAH